MPSFLLGVVLALLFVSVPFAGEVLDALGKAVIALMVVAFVALPFCFGWLRRLGR